jgi:hypothetical protein
MIKWIVAFVFMVLILGLALDVFACDVRTIIIDGRIINCVVCPTVTNCS